MYLFLDCETGGVTTEASLLTAAFVLYDNQGNFISDLCLTCKPENEIFCVTPGALKVNNINLESHLKEAKTYKDCTHELKSWLDNHKVSKETTILVGHRVKFDIDFVTKYLLTDKELFSCVNRTAEDTAVIASFLGYKFKNLKNLAELLNLNTSSTIFHTALGDCLLTADIYFDMKFRVYGE